MGKQRLLQIAGLIWVIVGLFLIYRGSGLYNLAVREFNTYFGGYVVVASIYCGIGMALIAASSVYWKNEQLPPAEEVS